MKRRSFLFCIPWLALALPVPAAQASITITIQRADYSNNSVYVRVGVQSTYEIAEVRARIDDREASLEFVSSIVFTHEGYLDVDGLVHEVKTLFVTATDVMGNQAEETTDVRIDDPPTIIVDSPTSGTITTELYVSARCIDDYPNCEIEVWTGFEPGRYRRVMSGVESVEGVIDLSGYEYKWLWISIESGGVRTARIVQAGSIEQYVEIEPAPGLVLDIDDRRMLCAIEPDDSYWFVGAPVEWRTLGMLDRGTGHLDVVTLPGERVVDAGDARLTTTGALVLADGDLYFWDGDQLALRSGGHSGSLVSAGRYAIWYSGNGNSRWDAMDQSLVRIVGGVNGGINWGNDVSEEGNVANWDIEGDVYLYKDETTTKIAAGSQPRVGGNMVVYTKEETDLDGTVFYGIGLFDGNSETILSRLGSSAPSPGSSYDARNDWVAFRTSDALVLRDPLGGATVISDTPASLTALEPNGDVMFNRAGVLHLANGQGIVQFTAPAGIGRPVLLNGTWRRVLDSGVYALEPQTPVLLEDLRGEVTTSGALLSWRMREADGGSAEKIVVQRAFTATGPFTDVSIGLPLEREMRFHDPEAELGFEYWYRLLLVDVSGNRRSVAVLPLHASRGWGQHTLHRPQMSTDGTVVMRYELGSAVGHLRLSVYDVRGRLVHVFRDAAPAPGAHSLRWTRRDWRGQEVPLGVYFVRLQADTVIEARRLVILGRHPR